MSRIFREALNFRVQERKSVIGTLLNRRTKDIYKKRFWDPHEEMREVVDGYNYNSLIQSAVNSLTNFVYGSELRVISRDKKTEDYFNAHIKSTNLDLHIVEVIENTIKTGNGYLEVERNPVTNMPYEYVAIADSSRIYINCDRYGKPTKIINPRTREVSYDTSEYYLQEVDKAFTGKGAKTYEIKYYNQGSYYARVIRAIPIPMEKICHFRLNLGDTGLYGRSFIASSVNDNEILYEMERAMAVLAKYRAVPRKLFQLGDDKVNIGNDEKDQFIAYMENLEMEENVIVNKPIKTEDLSYAGRDIKMDFSIDHIRKKIIAGMAPEFLVGLGDATNRATAKEQLVAYLLFIKSLRQRFLRKLDEIVIKPIIEYNQKIGFRLSPDARFVFGDLNFETKIEKEQRITQAWVNNEITFNEMRESLEKPAVPDEMGNLFYIEWQQEILLRQQQKAMDVLGTGEEPMEGEPMEGEELPETEEPSETEAPLYLQKVPKTGGGYVYKYKPSSTENFKLSVLNAKNLLLQEIEKSKCTLKENILSEASLGKEMNIFLDKLFDNLKQLDPSNEYQEFLGKLRALVNETIENMTQSDTVTEVKNEMEKVFNKAISEVNLGKTPPPMPSRPPKPGHKWKYTPGSGWFQIKIKGPEEPGDKGKKRIPVKKPDKFELRAKIDMLRDAMEQDFSLAVDVYDAIVKGNLQDEERAIMGNLILNDPDNFLSVMKGIIKDPNFAAQVVRQFGKKTPKQEPKVGPEPPKQQ